MLALVSDGLTYLQSQSATSLFVLFWFVVIFEVPRYTLPFAIAAFYGWHKKKAEPDYKQIGRITVMIAGHNEEAAIERCVLGLREQSLQPDEIIVVSDGSTDRMTKKLNGLLRRGLIQRVHGTDLRAGKAAAMNLALRFARGDILINIDCDCSFDRHALKHIVRPFADAEVGAVSGNIFIRNAHASLIATFQAIEYLISISLGKQALGHLGQVSCASGAFCAFRRTALDQVGGLDAGGGEDLDLTLRLRRADWKIIFEADAVCYTDVPHSLSALVRQRLRWERDSVRLRYRKHGEWMNPFSKRFQPMELIHELDFLLFNIVGGIALPFYCVWLFVTYGDLAPAILIAAQAGLLGVDLIIFMLAVYAVPQKSNTMALLPYVLGYSVFNSFFMRTIRVAAYLQEWIFKASYSDSFVPEKVQRVRE